MFSPYFALDREGIPATYLGFKGVIQLELISRGGEWGGPRAAGIHSMHGAWIGSPAWRLVRALNTLLDGDEQVLIPGFYDQVSGPGPEEEALLEDLGDFFDPVAILQELDAGLFKLQEPCKLDLLRRYLYSPVLNLDGLVSGYTGKGIKTMIDCQAVAKMDIRLVPEMRKDRVLDLLRQYLDRGGFPDIEMRVIGGYEWSRVSISEPVVQALLASYEDHEYPRGAIWPFLAGSGPQYLFTQVLGLPAVLGGLGHGGNVHSVNEYAILEHLPLFEKSVATFLYRYASWKA